MYNFKLLNFKYKCFKIMRHKCVHILTVFIFLCGTVHKCMYKKCAANEKDLFLRLLNE